MYNWANLDSKNIVVGYYSSSTLQSIDPQIPADITLVNIIGMQYDGTSFVIPLKTFEENKAQKLLDLNTYINAQKKAFEAPYDDVSLASFTDKRADYFASLNGGATSVVDLLSIASDGTVDTVKRDALLAAIGVKVKAVLALESFGDDTRTTIKNAIDQIGLDLVIIP